ncbi:putative phage tail protein [Burkholderia anthina]|uniref:YmfQ family protein n=1 Tax=Burkholderia anthina TaxID=179879 RepID=UPI00158AFB82
MNKHASLLGRLLPPTSYDPNGLHIKIELQAEGNALDRVQADGSAVEHAVTPYGAYQMLPDYERVYGIVPPADATLQQRVATVIAKMNETGGLSISYFKRLAAQLGYTIDIVEPQPFRVDSGRIGDQIFVEDIIFVWEVIVSGRPEVVYYFRVGQSTIGERLLSFSDPILEQVFNDLKPAHTFVYFVYQG